MGNLILGINLSGQDSAVALVGEDGDALYALAEERFSNIKHDGGFPRAALAVIQKRIQERNLGTIQTIALSGSAASGSLEKDFPEARIVHLEPSLAHAAGAFFSSGFDHAAIMVLDGNAGRDPVHMFEGRGGNIKPLAASEGPHGLGSLYLAVTKFLGFSGAGEEYKVMGMAAYGKPRFKSLFEKIASATEDGELVFSSEPSLFVQELGAARRKDRDFTQFHYDIAASLQAFIEETGVKLAKALRAKLPDPEALCLSGGGALNGLMTQKILEQAGFKNIYIQPAAADDGAALGAALNTWADQAGRAPTQALRSMFLGLDYPENLAQQEIESFGLVCAKPADMTEEVARLLAEGKIVARYEGRSEFGPRALGNRSILASPLSAAMKDTLNERIKHREPFRPFAPICLAEKIGDYFKADASAEYMLLICPVKPDKRETIPAVTHADGTARVQAVHRDVNPGLHAILEAFERHTGVPVLINTSFNVNGEAIVETPRDAIECFLYTDIDYLMIEGRLIAKADNADKAIRVSNEAFLERRKKRYL